MNTNKILTTLALTVMLSGFAHAGGVKPRPVTLPAKVLTYPAGHYLAGKLIPVGFDAFGYNYQGHRFSGYYANAFLGGDGLPPYNGDAEAYLAANPSAATKDYWPERDVRLDMKWDDAWLSNQDADRDGLLDRHPGFPGYQGSGAWLTNHLWGDNDDGSRWFKFAKIVAVPLTANRVAGIWYDARGTEIGREIWDSFAIIFEVINDPMTGDHGKQYGSLAGPGLGKY